MRIAFFGVEDLGVHCLSALLRAGYPVVGVVTLPGATPVPLSWLGRLRGQPGTVEAIARSRHLPVAMPTKLKDPAFRDILAAWRPDLLIVACFDKILPADMLASVPMGGLNVHPSLLPRWRGPAPVARALLAGDRVTGVTVHVMEAGIDTGDWLVQREVAIEPDETTGQLVRRLAELAPDVLLPAVRGLEAGSLVPTKQVGEVVQAPFISWEEACLDWSVSASRIERVVRACSPYPGAFLLLGEQVVAILKAEVVPGETGATPGRILRVAPGQLVIQTGDGALLCRSLRKGGQELPARAWPETFPVGHVLPTGDWGPIPSLK